MMLLHKMNLLLLLYHNYIKQNVFFKYLFSTFHNKVRIQKKYFVYVKRTCIRIVESVYTLNNYLNYLLRCNLLRKNQLLRQQVEKRQNNHDSDDEIRNRRKQMWARFGSLLYPIISTIMLFVVLILFETYFIIVFKLDSWFQFMAGFIKFI